MTPSRLSLTIDLDRAGHQIGDLMLRWSDNSNPLGYHPVPVISIRGGAGPVLLVLGGTHGDEFEGPAAILRLAARLRPEDLSGQLILMPAFNGPAVAASSRISPLDGQNLNRAFPGHADGGPTAMLAHFVEQELMPRCDAVIDLHSGGKASFFAPSALVTHTADAGHYDRNMGLARAFGLPLVWRLGAHNDNRSVNGAAERQGVAMIAAELGGGGGVGPGITDQAEAGLLGCLRHLGMMAGSPEPVAPRMVEIADPQDTLFAPADGLFDRACRAGQDVCAGDVAGTLRFIGEPARPAQALTFPNDGFVLAHTCRGMVRRGEMLALVVRDVAET